MNISSFLHHQQSNSPSWIFVSCKHAATHTHTPPFIIGRENRGGCQRRKWVGSTRQKCGPLSPFTTSPLFRNKRVYTACWITHTFHTSFQPERASCVRESPCYPECFQKCLQKLQSRTLWILEMRANHHILVIHCNTEQLIKHIWEHQCIFVWLVYCPGCDITDDDVQEFILCRDVFN